MRYKLKISDILLSIFVEFCIMITVGAFVTVLARPIISQEESRPIVVLSIVWTIGTISLLLTGAGWKRELNKIVLLLIFAMGSISIFAGLNAFSEMFVSLAVFIVFVLSKIGEELAYSKWIEKLVIIKRDPEYEEVQQHTPSRNEPLGELFG